MESLEIPCFQPIDKKSMYVHSLSLSILYLLAITSLGFDKKNFYNQTCQILCKNQKIMSLGSYSFCQLHVSKKTYILARKPM